MKKLDKGTEKIKKYSELVAQNLWDMMRERRISQKDLYEISQKTENPLSKGTISTILAGKSNLSLPTLAGLCECLGAKPEDFFREHKKSGKLKEEYTEEKKEEQRQRGKTVEPGAEAVFPGWGKSQGLVTEPDAREFKGYLGMYNIYFYPTIRSTESRLLHGELHLEPAGSRVDADLILYTGQQKRMGEKLEEVTKHYRGTFVISISMRAAYCMLMEQDIGELCFFLFHHFYLMNRDLTCAMAAAVTASAGANKRPTLHRLCLTRNPVTQENEKYLRGQLVLNDSDILIAEGQFKKMIEQEEFPEEFIDALYAARRPESYLSLSEHRLRGLEISGQELAKALSLVRSYANAPLYNKISERTDEMLFQFLDRDDV